MQFSLFNEDEGQKGSFKKAEAAQESLTCNSWASSFGRGIYNHLENQEASMINLFENVEYGKKDHS